MKCILHVGVHKTGTTAIQNALSGFDDGQVAYADLGEANHSIPFQTLYSEDRLWPHWKRYGYSKNQHNQLVENFERKMSATCSLDRDLIIFSGENISILDVSELEKVKSNLDVYFDEVQVLMYIREPSEWAASMYQEQIKHGMVNNSLAHTSLWRRYLNLVKVFEESNVRVVNYDNKNKYGGNIVASFLEECGIQTRVELLKDISKVANVTISEQALKFGYIFNKSKLDTGMGKVPNKCRYHMLYSLDRIFSKTSKISSLPFSVLVDSNETKLINQEFGFNFDDAAPQNTSLDSWLSDIDNYALNELEDFLTEAGFYSGRLNDAEKAITSFFLFTMNNFENDKIEMSRVLNDSDADVLRDVSFKYETKKAISKAEALSLMKIAQRARPNGPFINTKISEWEE